MAEGISDSAGAIASQASTALSKRSHKKSRLGCTTCKLRKVKCDEVRPVCRSCRLRRTKCEYDRAPPRNDSSSETQIVPVSRSLPRSNMAEAVGIVKEPLFCPPAVDSVDMKRLWFYTSATYSSLSYRDDKQRTMNDMLQTVMVQHAFEAPFLMDSLLELASLHMQSLGQAPEETRTLLYRGRSFQGYREAIENAHPRIYGALLANSVLLPLLSTQFFRDPTSKSLYILDWIVLWQGVQTILTITCESSVAKSGMQPLFSRPPLDSDASADAIPKQLLLMVSFIDPNDEDAAELQIYQGALRALGSLFENLQKDIDSVMVLRVITWCTITPPRFLDLARDRRPRALVILAYYAAFLKLLNDIWWLEGVGDRTIRDICHALAPEWHKFLGIPISTVLLTSTSEIARAILYPDLYQINNGVGSSV